MDRSTRSTCRWPAISRSPTRWSRPAWRLSTGIDTAAALGALDHLKGASGRLELVGSAANGAPVYVDYAHKPDALENVLTAVRPFTTGRVHRGVRLRRRPRPRQAADHGRDRRPSRRCGDRDRRQSALGRPGLDPRRHLGSGARCDRDRRPPRGDPRRPSTCFRPGDTLIVAGKGHEEGQTSATDATVLGP